MHRRPVHSKRNNRLNVVIAGSGGCGKSTLVNALCGGHEVASTTEWLDSPPQQAAQPRPLRLKTYTEDMADSELGSVTLRLVETQGFGENLDNTSSIADIAKYIAGQYDEVLAEESRIKRNPRFIDNRVHAVIYMIEATGHGLREQDIEFMRQVGPIANIIPVIAKADALTPSEVLTNKRLIVEDIEHYKLPIYQFMDLDQVDNDRSQQQEDVEALIRLQESLPLAIVASSKSVQLGSSEKFALVREYGWGWLHIEDPKVSEFGILKEILLYSHMEELKESTNDVLYEHYRTLRLSADPEFNAAESAARAPITASRANLNEVAQGRNTYATSRHPVAIQPTNVHPVQAVPAQAVPHAVPHAAPHAVPHAPHVAHAPQAVPRQPPAQPAFHPGNPGMHTSLQPQGGYVSRENHQREEEALFMRDEKSVENDLELRRQELLKRELELQRLEERLRQESQQLNVPPSQSLQHRINKLGE